MRLFVCTFLNAGNQTFYGRHVADLIETSAGRLRAIPEGSAHLTHAFLGETDDDQVAGIRDALGSIGGLYGAIAIRLGPPAILFARATPRLICAHVVHGGFPVSQLAADIAMALEPWCTGMSGAPARSPHVTLARFRRNAGPGDARAVIAALAAGNSADLTRDDSIASIHIVSSTLSPEGPVYTVIADVPLRGC